MRIKHYCWCRGKGDERRALEPLNDMAVAGAFFDLGKYGSIAAVTVVLLPLMAWARIELEHHSLAQVTAGALLAALIVIVVFYPFGLV